MIKIDIDKLTADGNMHLLVLLTRDGKEELAFFAGFQISKDIELDPNYPDGKDGYVCKRTVPGYEWVTLKFKVMHPQ